MIVKYSFPWSYIARIRKFISLWMIWSCCSAPLERLLRWECTRKSCTYSFNACNLWNLWKRIIYYPFLSKFIPTFCMIFYRQHYHTSTIFNRKQNVFMDEFLFSVTITILIVFLILIWYFISLWYNGPLFMLVQYAVGTWL